MLKPPLYKHCLYVTLLFRYMPDVTVLAAEKLNSTVFVAVVSHTIVDIIELNVSVFVLGEFSCMSSFLLVDFVLRLCFYFHCFFDICMPLCQRQVAHQSIQSFHLSVSLIQTTVWSLTNHNMHASGLWEGSTVPRGNPCKHVL